MDDFIQVLKKKKLVALNYFPENRSRMSTEEVIATQASDQPSDGRSSKNPNSDQSTPVREPFFTNFVRKRDTVISAIRSNYRTSIYSLTVDQFTMVLFQKQFSPISPFFLVYKYCHSFTMLGALGISIWLKDSEEILIEWHLFLDHWMSVAGSAEALCGVFTVTYFYHHCRTKAMRDAYPLSEGLHIRLLIYAIINSTTITFVCASTVIFWFFIYGKSVSTSLSIEHIVLPALLLVKMNIEMVPFTVDRFMYPVVLLQIYFINVIVHYYVDYRSLFNAGKPKNYIFIYFNEKSLLHFLWFVLESLLITVAVHILLTLLWHIRWLFLHMCCPKRARLSPERASERNSSSDGTRTGYAVRGDFVEAVPDPSKTARQRCMERIADLERSYRHDFIQPEWKQKLCSSPPYLYVVYRTAHMILHFCMLFISLFEPEKPLTSRNVKYFILWAFYFGNFFLCVSFIQSLIGFTVIVMAYSRKTSLKYYERSELYVTGFQKLYAAINGCAVALAIFAFVSSWVLVDDTRNEFSSHDYTYDVPHLVNPLSMCLDFLIVGHPYKFIYFVLSFGILAMNIVFNYWLYSSKITGRSGTKFVYEYLNWDKTNKVAIHIAVLYSMLITIHFALWLGFLGKRSINVVFRRRRLYRPREQKHRDSFDSILGPEGRYNQKDTIPSSLVYELSPTHTNTIDFKTSVSSRGQVLEAVSSKTSNTVKST